MKKLLNPKTLAITAIVTTILNLILSVILKTSNIPSYFHFNLIIRIILNFVLCGNLYITIYFFIVLMKKQKNMKLLNTILFINLIIATIVWIISEILSIKNIFIMGLSYNLLGMLFNLISQTLFLVLETIMVYGILAKKNLPYKVFTIILLTLNFIWFALSIISILSSGFLLLSFVNLLSTIITIIQTSSFVLFIYLYGKSISERSKNNE